MGVEMDLSDPSTFAAAYDRYAPGVYGSAMRILGDPVRAQDVTQDVFLRIWRTPSRFDARRGELGSYLRLMARSRALDLWREQQAAGRAQDRMESTAAHQATWSDDDRPANVIELRAQRDVVRDALARLPLKQREAIVLAYFGGLTADEIARRAGVPLGTAKSRLRLGLDKLRAELGDVLESPHALAAAA